MKKYSGYIIAAMMVLGITIGFIGLDFDQTQVAWKVPLATPLMIIGFGMFGVGFLWLLFGSKN